MEYLVYLLTIGLMYAVLAVSYNLLIGYAGLLSVAHAAFFGTGAYTAGLLAARYGSGAFLGSLVAGAFSAALVAAVIAIASLRLTEEYLMIATFGLQIVITSVLLNWVEVTGGARGLSWIPRAELFGTVLSRTGFLWVMLAISVVVVGFTWYVVSSPYGRVLKAMRDNEVAARALGKDVVRYRTQIFMLSGALAGLMGGLFAYYIRFVEPFSFTIDLTILILSMVVLGGTGSLWGSLLGAFILLGMSEVFNFVELPASVVGPARQMMYGTLLVVFMLYRPEGLVGEYLGSRGNHETR